uniref:Uncharacterized protein n=1 Tax=Rhizobium leguminosarum TaxID=384 RepID=A0A179C1Q4_RHILE|nr:hypothetical protein A4U53_36670 [Rhizobium leguminosarum]
MIRSWRWFASALILFVPVRHRCARWVLHQIIGQTDPAFEVANASEICRHITAGSAFSKLEKPICAASCVNTATADRDEVLVGVSAKTRELGEAMFERMNKRAGSVALTDWFRSEVYACYMTKPCDRYH